MSDPIKKIALKNGTTRYRFVVDVGRNPETGKRKQLTYTFDRKTEAENEYFRIKHEKRIGTFVVPSKVTVAEWLDTWVASATRDAERATVRNYKDAVAHVRDRLGHRQLQSLTEADIEQLVDWMLEFGRKRGGKAGTGLGARSVELMLNRLRAALNMAVRRQLVVRNVAQYVTVPRAARNAAKVAKAKRVPWTEAEAKEFLGGIRHARLYPVMFLSLMGMRPAEVCGLRWVDVDLDAGTLSIETTRTLVEGEVEEKDPKSENGKRTLPLPNTVITGLRAFKAQQAKEKLAAGDGYEASGRVVVDELGRAVKTDWLRRQTYKLMEEVGVRKVRPYDARHACLTLLATSGVPDVVVSAWAGHADLSFTKKVYVHPDTEQMRPAANRLDELFG